MAKTKSGFSFDLVKRNALLEEREIKAPSNWSTGTTLAAARFKVNSASSV